MVVATKKRKRIASSYKTPSMSSAAVTPYRKQTNYGLLDRFWTGRTYRFKRTAPTVTISNVPVSGQQFAYSYQLSDLDNSTEFTALFDRYRIRQIQVNYRPAVNMFALTVNSGVFTGPYPTAVYCYHAIDKDDATIVVDTLIRQYDTCITRTLGQKFSRKFTPKIAMSLYSGTFTSFGSTNPDQWVDCASPSVQYYGTKFNMEALNGSQTGEPLWFIDNVYYIEFMNPR